MEKPGEFLVSFTYLDPVADWMQMFGVYERLVMTNALRTVYWDRAGAEFLTFPEWHSWFKSSKVHLFKSNYQDEFVGIMTLYDCSERHRCFCGTWVEPRWRGHKTMEMGKQALTYVHGQLGFENVFAASPWNAAQQFCSRIGMEHIATLPGYCKYKDKTLDVDMFRSTRKMKIASLSQDLTSMGWMPKSAYDLAYRTIHGDG